MRGEPLYSCPKDARGEQRIAQKVQRKATVTAQERVMEAAKRRDGRRCRWPHETAQEREMCRMLGVEACHLEHRGAGGDKRLVRTKLELLITFGARCHDRYDGRLGERNRRVRFLTPQKASGSCAFEVKKGGAWWEIGREISIGVLA